MKYIYRNIEETEQTKAFVKTMAKLDLIDQTIGICHGFKDNKLIEELEAKQCRLMVKLTSYYEHKYGINGKYTSQELKDEFNNGAILIEFMNQENITSIEEKLLISGINSTN